MAEPEWRHERVVPFAILASRMNDRQPRNMRFVPVKSGDQLDIQSPQHVGDRRVARRTPLIDQMRGFTVKSGISVPSAARVVSARERLERRMVFLISAAFDPA